MRTFKSNSEAKKVAEQIAKTTVFYTNEGLEITFTSDVNNQKEIAEELKKVFSDVKLKGRKIPSIVINRISQVKKGIRIIEVTY